ncbi:MAG: aminopeptidase P family protein [Rhodothermales bacterium]|nr:aminopeptidase P family protein [Rhodothermales bacterium]
MENPFLRALPLALLLAACASPAAEPLPFGGDPWPDIRQDRIHNLLPGAMDEAGVDTWLTLCRENNNDPLARHVGCENAGGTAAFLFFRTPEGVKPVAISPAGEATSLAELGTHEVFRIERGTSIWNHVVGQLEAHGAQRVAINSGGRAAADGLSHTQYEALAQGLGEDWMARTVSSEELVVAWLSVKTPEEVDIMRRAAALTARWEVEAYEQVIPGEWTDLDIANYLEARMAEAGVGDGWSPAQNPAVNSGKDRGHSHPTERVIQPGDFIQIDFGIRVHDMWVTDIQRFAYVLAPGQDEAPPEALEKWNTAVRGSRAAFAAMKPGAYGGEVDRAQRVILDETGSVPVMWGTGHPVGYWAHDVGPRLGGGNLGRELNRNPDQRLKPGMTFAFDGFYSWPLSDSTTKTISVEEMVVITESGAEWLTPPQDDLILIPSR